MTTTETNTQTTTETTAQPTTAQTTETTTAKKSVKKVTPIIRETSLTDAQKNARSNMLKVAQDFVCKLTGNEVYESDATRSVCEMTLTKYGYGFKVMRWMKVDTVNEKGEVITRMAEVAMHVRPIKEAGEQDAPTVTKAIKQEAFDNVIATAYMSRAMSEKNAPQWMVKNPLNTWKKQYVANMTVDDKTPADKIEANKARKAEFDQLVAAEIESIMNPTAETETETAE